MPPARPLWPKILRFNRSVLRQRLPRSSQKLPRNFQERPRICCHPEAGLRRFIEERLSQAAGSAAAKAALCPRRQPGGAPPDAFLAPHL